MSRGGERACHDIDQESCRSPNADSRHARQDWMKGVSKHEALNFFRDLFALTSQRCQLLSHAWQHDTRSLRAQDYDRLFGECLDDFRGQTLASRVRM